ncbi:MAG: hypothetical protein C4516_05875 [Oxalobacter sp.]|nr:MAG: hypothetical protein C4516_05875 [Oxalobacter sp.]
MSTPKSEISIPILTQIIAPSATNAPAGTPKKTGRVNETSTSATVLAASMASSALSPATLTSGASLDSHNESAFDGDWKTLELKLNERVLGQILRRIDFVIEHRVKESLAEVLQSTTDTLVKDIRRGLHVTLEDVIKRAVAQEIARVQSVKE